MFPEQTASLKGERVEMVYILLRCGFPCPTNYNPADHYLQVLAVVPGQEEASHAKLKKVCDDFENSERGLELTKTSSEATKTLTPDSSMVTTRSSPYKASWGEQFTALLWRSWLSIVKDPMILKIRIGTSIVSFLNFSSHCFPSVHCFGLGCSLLWSRALWRGECQGGRDHEHQRRPLPPHH